MKQYTVLRRRWIERGKDQDPQARMESVMTLTAPSPADALRIAKQKGEVHPIIEEKQHAQVVQ